MKEKECIRCGHTYRSSIRGGFYGCFPGWGAFFKRHMYKDDKKQDSKIIII